MDGQRKTTSIAEITGMEGDVVTMQEIFKFEQYGLDENLRVIGRHVATGVRPRFADICKAKGIDIPTDIFEKDESPPPSLK
jgi:pilus assembly protein CpaF